MPLRSSRPAGPPEGTCNNGRGGPARWRGLGAAGMPEARPRRGDPIVPPSLPLSSMSIDEDAHVGVSGGPNTSGGARIIWRRTAGFSPREIGVRALDRRDAPMPFGLLD